MSLYAVKPYGGCHAHMHGHYMSRHGGIPEVRALGCGGSRCKRTLYTRQTRPGTADCGSDKPIDTVDATPQITLEVRLNRV
jgi:hypothetical protein